MKKIIKLFVFMFMLVLFINTVYAAQDEAVCTYNFSSNNSNNEVTVKLLGNKVSVSMRNVSQGVFASTFVYEGHEITKDAFFRTDKLKCPGVIYYKSRIQDEYGSSSLYVTFRESKGGEYNKIVNLTTENIISTTPETPNNNNNQNSNTGTVTIPEQCTETGRTYDICTNSFNYDASRNMCVWKPWFVEFKQPIVNKDGGYGDYKYFEDDGDKEVKQPVRGTCDSKHVLATGRNGQPLCYPKVCPDGKRSGSKCIQCEELKSNSKYYGYGGESANLAQANQMDCSKIKELTDPIWTWLMIIGPTLALVLGVLDLLKGVASGDDKTVKKSMSDFGKRLGLAALLLLLPTIVNLIIGLVEFGNIGACL